jgi:hypothetical protein
MSAVMVSMAVLIRSFSSGVLGGKRRNINLILDITLLLLLPLALQPAVGFGLSNNTSPFVPIYHQLSPSSHS